MTNELLALKPIAVEKVVTQMVTKVAEPSNEVIMPQVMNTMPKNGETCVPHNEIRITMNTPCGINGFSVVHGFTVDEFSQAVLHMRAVGYTIILPYKMKHACYYSVKITFFSGVRGMPRKKLDYVYTIDVQ